LNPDDASLSKTKFASYYFGIYLRIINSVRYSSNLTYKEIVYLDLFAGQGCYGNNISSVPLEILNMVFENNIKNIQ
jgi:hypothetical protein